jgi:hypothetical protein
MEKVSKVHRMAGKITGKPEEE